MNAENENIAITLGLPQHYAELLTYYAASRKQASTTEAAVELLERYLDLIEPEIMATEAAKKALAEKEAREQERQELLEKLSFLDLEDLRKLSIAL